MEFETLQIRRDGGTARVTIDRPEAMNALSPSVLEDLDACFEALGADRETRVVILTGAGAKAFVAGADIKAMAGFDATQARAYADRGQAVLRRIETLGKPVIAAVNGFALGGGMELAMACHLRIASSNARFGQPEVKLGVITGFGGSQRLPRIVGLGRALELLLSGEMIDADKAHGIGLVGRVVEPESLLEEAESLARVLVQRSPLALRWILEAALAGTGLGMEEGSALEANLFGLCFSTQDQKEGMKAFLEKREPNWEGC